MRVFADKESMTHCNEVLKKIAEMVYRDGYNYGRTTLEIFEDLKRELMIRVVNYNSSVGEQSSGDIILKVDIGHGITGEFWFSSRLFEEVSESELFWLTKSECKNVVSIFASKLRKTIDGGKR